MDWLKKLLEKYHLGLLSVVLSMLSITFISNLFIAAADGIIDPAEYHSLSTGANGVELLVLFIVTSVLRKRGN